MSADISSRPIYATRMTTTSDAKYTQPRWGFFIAREVDMSEIIERLKPCPFCGTKGAASAELDMEQGNKWGAIVCGCCGAKGPEVRTRYEVDEEFVKEAGKEWDGRTINRGERRVVCAANRMPDGAMFIGARHWDEHMSRQADDYIRIHGLEDHKVGIAEQGFIDQWGKFLTRADAWEVALSMGQVIFTAPGRDGPELYSENLY